MRKLLMFIVQQTDISNCLRFFNFNSVSESLSGAAENMLNGVLSRTPNDCCWVDLHEGKFYHQTSTTPKYTVYNTLFDQRDGSAAFPDTWESLLTYLQTHCVDLGWADRGSTEVKIVELSPEQIAKFRATVVPVWGNVPYSAEEQDQMM